MLFDQNFDSFHDSNLNVGAMLSSVFWRPLGAVNK